MVEINQCIGAPLDVMRYMVESKNLEHPVLWDAGCQNTRAYGITAWPFAYLIGADGRVFWEGNPSRWIRREKKVKEMRRLIEAELSEARGRQRPFAPLSRLVNVVHCPGPGIGSHKQENEDAKVHCATDSGLWEACRGSLTERGLGPITHCQPAESALDK